MPVVGLTRVLPQVLSETRKLLAEAWAGQADRRSETPPAAVREA
jgi:ATP adenylyltransferase